MATQWMDDFQGYGTDASRVSRMLNGPYAEAAGGSAGGDLVADPDATAGGKYVWTQGGNANSAFRKTLTTAVTTIGSAFRLWLSSIPASSNNLMVLASFRDVNNIQHGYLTVDASGYLRYYRSDSGGDVQLGISSSPVVVSNSWTHYEIKVVIDATVGSVEVRKEGIQVLLATSVKTTTNNASVASVQNVAMKNTYFGGPAQYFKDWIVWDGTTANNNNFFGSCQVYRLTPNADVVRNWNTTLGAAPIQSAIVGSTTGGTLPAATYYYTVTAILSPQGESIASNEQSVVNTGTTSSNVISWTAPIGMTVTAYKVYRGTSAGGENVYYSPGNVLTYTDTNAASTGGTSPVDSGTGFSKINELTPDDDGTFITAGQSPYPAAYQATMTQLPNNVVTVKSVMTIHRSRKTDGGSGNITTSLISGANTGVGANNTITTAYTYWTDIFETDPSGVNWSKTLVNALKLKLDRTL